MLPAPRPTWAECLDGAQRFLKPDGISIPQSYTSYLQPISSHKLWNDTKVGKSSVWGLASSVMGACKHGPEILVRCVAIQLAREVGQLAVCLLERTRCALSQAYDDLEHFETPYVVKLFRFNPLAPPQVLPSACTMEGTPAAATASPAHA